MTHEDIIKQIEARRPPAWDLLNVKLVSYDPALNRVVTECNAETRHCHSTDWHPMGGIVQGGIVTGWLDAAMACACMFQGDHQIAIASLEIKVTFLLPAHPGLYRAYASVLRAGRSVAFMEAELRDKNNHLIARASSTAAVRPRKGTHHASTSSPTQP